MNKCQFLAPNSLCIESIHSPEVHVSHGEPWVLELQPSALTVTSGSSQSSQWSSRSNRNLQAIIRGRPVIGILHRTTPLSKLNGVPSTVKIVEGSKGQFVPNTYSKTRQNLIALLSRSIAFKSLRCDPSNFNLESFFLKQKSARCFNQPPFHDRIYSNPLIRKNIEFAGRNTP